MPSSSVAMAVASRSPIQMGRFSLLSGSRRMTIGVLVTGSSVRPPTVFILMTVGGLTLDPVTKTPIVILRDPDNKLNLPIWIGLLEATAMATELEGIKMARPMTHDLLRSVIGEVGASVEWVEVTDLKDNTYFALIYLRVDGRQVTIDARPSDAISLALRTKSPIYVAKKVLEASSVLQQMEEGKDQDLSNVSRDKLAEILEKMSPDDFKYKI